MRIHYLQHVPFENPGIILNWAEQRTYPVTCTRLFEDQELPAQTDFDWLVIMGGPMNIYEEERYPWLIREKEFIKEAISNNKIILGLCLGAQLIADVIGGRVIQNQYKEIGWFPVTFTEEALAMQEFSHFPINPVVFEWHGDTFIDLPEDSILLASNGACKNQAFVYRGAVYGFQFHMENTMQIITDLIENCGEEMVPGIWIQTAGEILAGTEFIDQNNQWMQLFLDKLADFYEESGDDMEQIRYKQRNCTDTAVIEEFLEKSRTGVIGISGSSYPYCVPVNYIWKDGAVYFHGLGSGKKNQLLQDNQVVCFTVYQEFKTVKDPVPCHADTAYRSVMLFGLVEKVEDFKEISEVLQALVDKFMPDFYKSRISPELAEKYRSAHDGKAVAVYKIMPVERTAKENVADIKDLEVIL